jgi:hypothetical protein
LFKQTVALSTVIGRRDDVSSIEQVGLAITRAAPQPQDPSDLSVRTRIENGVQL